MIYLMTLLTLLNFVKSQPNIEDFLSELKRPRNSQFSKDELSLLLEAGQNDVTALFNDNNRPDAKLIMDMMEPLTHERNDPRHSDVKHDAIVNVMGNPTEISGCKEG